MNTTILYPILIGVTVIIYIMYKQIVQQPVSQRDFLLKLIAAIYAVVTIANTSNWNMALAVVVGGGLGVLTGLASGQVVRVWRDGSTGIVYQRGGWSYVLVLLSLLVVRLVIFVVLQKMGIGISIFLLDGALIALAVSNYLGRTINVHMRAEMRFAMKK